MYGLTKHLKHRRTEFVFCFKFSLCTLNLTAFLFSPLLWFWQFHHLKTVLRDRWSNQKVRLAIRRFEVRSSFLFSKGLIMSIQIKEGSWQEGELLWLAGLCWRDTHECVSKPTAEKGEMSRSKNAHLLNFAPSCQTASLAGWFAPYLMDFIQNIKETFYHMFVALQDKISLFLCSLKSGTQPSIQPWKLSVNPKIVALDYPVRQIWSFGDSSVRNYLACTVFCYLQAKFEKVHTCLALYSQVSLWLSYNMSPFPNNSPVVDSFTEMNSEHQACSNHNKVDVFWWHSAQGFISIRHWSLWGEFDALVQNWVSLLINLSSLFLIIFFAAFMWSKTWLEYLTAFSCVTKCVHYRPFVFNCVCVCVCMHPHVGQRMSQV